MLFRNRYYEDPCSRDTRASKETPSTSYEYKESPFCAAPIISKRGDGRWQEEEPHGILVVNRLSAVGEIRLAPILLPLFRCNRPAAKEDMAMRSTKSPRKSLGYGLGAVCAIGLALASAAVGQESYGFVRVVEGYADLVQSSSQSVVEATNNYPILVGDQLRVSQGARLEAVLPDGSYLRLDSNTELKFGRIALSGDTDDESTLLHLLQGQVQVVIPAEAGPVDEYRIDTANATLYLQKGGTYRIFTDGDSWTEIVVRSGVAEVVTERGSAIVRTEEEAVVDGSRMPRVAIETAAAKDSLERWGDDLLFAARVPEQTRYVAPSLGYAASPLYRHGSWVQVGGRTAWRPRVSVGWRPYHSGWWVYTPSGLTWVSTEPWGWVTHHYGVWDYALGMGWVWHPGQVYSPGAVYWYWGPSYVGWIPAGYYSRFYRYPFPHSYRYPGPRYGHGYGHSRPGFGVHGGIHGWAGGHVSLWADWTFSSYQHLGYRNSHAHLRTGAQLTRQGVFKAGVPRGVITTNTRQVTPELWHRPDQVRGVLERSHGTPMPDLSSWVARRPELAENVRGAIAPSAPSTSISSRPSRRAASPASPSPSPLGQAALSRSPVRARQQVAVPPSGQGSRSPTSRQWNPDVWKRDTRTRPLPTVPYRRDAHNYAPRPSGSRETPVGRRVWEGVRSYRSHGRPTIGSSSVQRPTPPTQYRRPSPAAPSARAPSRMSTPGSSSSSGRVSGGRASRSSGSSRTGGSSRGSSSRSSSGSGGSGSG